ncbi:hypothetical protein PQR02_17555 [Paraburkholderia sediminicola]|uniref:Uncharacterized protein n=1 Tax=Paraburkholderia rhynchosiae TaxID=487049 RepID=A0ACC7N976_9BURK
MCCAIVAVTMTLLAGWRSVSGTLGGPAGRMRRIAIVVLAIGAAAGSAMAADQFAAVGEGAPSLVTRLAGVPVCGHFIR